MARLNFSNVLAHFSHSGVDDMADNTCHFGINSMLADGGVDAPSRSGHDPAVLSGRSAPVRRLREAHLQRSGPAFRIQHPRAGTRHPRRRWPAAVRRASPSIRQGRRRPRRRRRRLHRGDGRNGVSRAGCGDHAAGAGREGRPDQQGHAERRGPGHDGEAGRGALRAGRRRLERQDRVWAAASAASCCRRGFRGRYNHIGTSRKVSAACGSRWATRDWIPRASRPRSSA